MTLSIEATLVKKRSEILAQIIEGAVDSAKTKQLLDELATADRMLDTFKGSPRDLRYAACPRAIDAVIMYLDERKVPASEDEIIEAVISGGWRGGGREHILNVHKGIGIFLNGTGKQTNLIKRINGLIGRYEWGEALFSPE